MIPLFIGQAVGGDRISLTEDDFETHLHGIGASRSGKSKLIEWIAREFIRRKQGFCLIDPHGSLYDDLLHWLTYLRPRQDIVLFNPSYQERIAGFNPFRLRDAALSTQVDRLIRATLKAWGATSTDDTARLERWLRCSFHTLLELRLPLPTLELLLGWKYPQVRSYIASQIESTLIRGELEKLASYTRPSDFDGQIESTWNKMFRFLSSKELVRLMGVPSNSIDIEKIVDQGQIFLVNLQPSPFFSREQARLVGTLLIDEMWSVLDQRKRVGSKKPRPFFLVIDEFQKYLTPDVPDMLDEAAKRGLHLLLFHQRLDQLRERDPEAYSAVTINARLKVVFGGLNREDARTMAEQIFPGQIEFDRVKYFVEQTKFWPKYTRDIVTTRSSGSSSGLGSGIGQAWDPNAEGWVDSPRSSDSHGDFEAEGSTEVPMLMPEPFIERTPGAVFSLDEMLWKLADSLMEQYQRHFFIRRPGHKTVAAVTPFVKPWTMSPARVNAYVERLTSSWLAANDVDEAIANARQELLHAATAAAEPVIVGGDGVTSPLKPKHPTLRKKPSRAVVLDVDDEPQPRNVKRQVGPNLREAGVEPPVRSKPEHAPEVPAFVIQYERLGLSRSDRLRRDLQQAEKFFNSGDWKECLLNARNVLEGVLWDVAAAHSTHSGRTLRFDPGPKGVRDYLRAADLVDDDAGRMLAQAYGRQSDYVHAGGTPTRENALLWLDQAKSLCRFVLDKFENSLGRDLS